MSAFALAWRNLVRQKRRSFLMIAVVAFGFAAFALAGGFIAQTFEGLKEGTIRSVGDLQIVDRRAVGKAEEAHARVRASTTRAARGRSRPPIPTWRRSCRGSTSWASRRTGASRSRFSASAWIPAPEAAATLAPELVVSGKYLSRRRRRRRRARHRARRGPGRQARRPRHADGDDARRLAERRGRHRRGPRGRADQGAERPVPRRRNRRSSRACCRARRRSRSSSCS